MGPGDDVWLSSKRLSFEVVGIGVSICNVWLVTTVLPFKADEIRVVGCNV